MNQCFEFASILYNPRGRCCCNCKYQKPIASHPWNNNILTQGPITNTIGYGCNVSEQETVFFDSKHGLCEEHRFSS